ncbi:pyrroline-5-carboxylate reductase [Niallia endozanthoxylica]|uniref:Pyrroline-5-carboxylate reductase n=1 Tax=Niallia endozanthoxylica TaxID=2036016 RepID=A0A5J5HBY1_9BACI|nr:pyrroline-5-carboxylate reductase [Niallia endozanthoxylica]KAA9017062.1 pyrroline-5-carboxylate reductase [Niallia endozanthoxylica]
MNKNIGFIGCGKMGRAIMAGMLKADIVEHNNIMVSTGRESTLLEVKECYKVQGSLHNQEVAEWSDLLFLAVHPSSHDKVLSEIKGSLKEDVVVITMAAGITIEQIEKGIGRKVKIVRTMPNTPSLVGEGMTAMSISSFVTETDLEIVKRLLNSFGRTEMIDENLMDAVPAISGSSPAYAYMFIEALADGGVRDGIPRAQAYRMAAQAMLGAAKMVLETGKHPGALKDDVCTPGGSTIRAVAALEENQFRAAILEAMKACTERTKGIGN